MNYKNLLVAHKAFYKGESKAGNYDKYMRRNNQESWTTSVPISEVDTLFRFIKNWYPNFRGDEDKFQWIYREIYPQLYTLWDERFEDTDFSNLIDNERLVCDRNTKLTVKKRNLNKQYGLNIVKR